MTLTINENQQGFCGVQGTIEEMHGAVHSNSRNNAGAVIAWQFSANEAMTVDVAIQYAYAAEPLRNGDLYLNNQLVTNVNFQPTGAWTNWQATSTSMTIQAGQNFIELKATGDLGLANIDYIKFTSTSEINQNASLFTANECQYDYSNIDPLLINDVLVQPTFSDDSVHDPSVIKSDGVFYVFGSHLAASKTTDLTNWTNVSRDGVNSNNPLFDDPLVELAQLFEWTGEQGMWALDVRKINDKFYMYYNASPLSAPRSAMGLAIADNIEGPYRDQGIFLKSGMWGEISPDGTIFDATKHPSSVDPHTFFDANGKLWMIYGSYSGGIFILEMDPATGKPKPNQNGYGKHLMGGNHSRIEGVFVQYNQKTEYYYLFSSFGGLGADGGYNVRIARSKNPDGPYLDYNGVNMANVKANPDLPLFDDASIEPYGLKAIGAHQFTNTNLGYISPGHNSTIYDEQRDKYLIFMHTRFPGRGELHQIRIHEILFNEDAWPVVSPLRYADKIDSQKPERLKDELEVVVQAQVPGTYQMVDHGKDISANVKPSFALELQVDGQVLDGQNGTWQYDEKNRYINLTINGLVYKGVVSRQWNESRRRFEITIAAVSSNGTTLWAIQEN
ncbi:family 43 glycosylhydrolase [Marinicellulosiphila megalodicopiae]|uniref:family 43 glycosylhydrolase n=1 Tax=Marinicellulosiphila megalodicopiae TaxID=2724896 RepID=UPI003BB0ECEC